jgi:hypothetical protein
MEVIEPEALSGTPGSGKERPGESDTTRLLNKPVTRVIGCPFAVTLHKNGVTD